VNQPRLYVALDTPSVSKAKEKAWQVNDVEGDFGFKLNLDLLLINGIGVVEEFKEGFGRLIFTDTKTWNGGRTMAELAVELARAGSSLVNIYAHAGVKFMSRVMKAVRESAQDVDVYALGVLTHYTDADCQRLYRRSLSETVRFFADEAAAAKVNGYIQPGTCLDVTSGMDIAKLVPAVRPNWYEDTKANSQEQTVTPEQAFGDGADIIVCGSPIFKSPDPAEALARLLQAVPAATPSDR
jgi:orotidine 5'-phosphate decarboxylase subfamily 1